MKVTKEEASIREVTLNVELDPEDIEPYLDRAYKRMVNRVQIPGFRPGKAPRVLVENYLGKEALVRDSLDFIVQESLDKAIQQEELETFGQPDVELTEVEPVTFKATVPLEPIVVLGEIGNINIEPETAEVTEEQVDKVVEQLQYNAAPWEPAERPVQFGDLVTLDVDGGINGEQVANDRGVDFIPTNDNPYPFPGFSLYLEGLEADSQKEFTLTVPEDYGDTSIAGQECRFDVKVLGIKVKALPELDDEFAKGVEDGYETLELLRTSILENLTSESERIAIRAHQEKILEEVIKDASLEISASTINHEIDHLLEDQARMQQGREANVDTYLQNVGKSREEIREELRPAAQERLNRYLIIRKLSQDENIEVSDEDVDQEVENLTSASGESIETLQQVLSTDDARSSLSSAILTRKVLERLVQIVQGGQTEEDSGPETEGAEDHEEASGSSPDQELTEPKV